MTLWRGRDDLVDDNAIFDAYVVGKPTCFFRRDVAERIPIAYLHVSLHERGI